MNDIINFVQAVGFPVVIAMLFYIDLRSVVNRNTQAINGLVSQQKQLVELLRK